MRSALRVPLFGGGAVVGAVLIYATREQAFSARDGLGLEQFAAVIAGQLARGASHGGAPDALTATAASGQALGGSHAGASASAEREQPVDAPADALADAAPDAPRIQSASDRSGAPGVLSAGDSGRLSALGELVSGVAHELNNPLTTILGYAQLLPALDGDELRQATATIEQEAQRAGRIVGNLLYFARQHRPRVEPVDVNAILTRVIDVQRYHLDVRNIAIEARLEPVPELLGDQYQLEQVFLNLLTNARQALVSGGTIRVASERVGEVVRVSVEDTGPGIPASRHPGIPASRHPGIPEELASRIFDPFFTTREVGEGSGLGLSIAYGIVQAHHGRLITERPPGGGARFVVELPLAEEDRHPASLLAGTQRGRGERVLVVEDEPAVRALVSTILRSGGYEVTNVQSGQEALRALQDGTFDMIVSDVRMPGLDGRGLFEAVLARWPALAGRMLFVSGDIEAERFATMLRQQDVRYLEKPFSTGELLGAVREVLDRPGVETS